MNSAGSLHPLLREEEIVVVENAIRLAIESIINVLYGVHSARANEYQRMMGERDKEIQRLEGRLRELEAPRRPAACASGRLQNADCSRLLGEPDSAEPQAGQQSRYEASSSEPEPDWERSAPVALSERPSLRISVQNRESCLPVSPSRRTLRQRGTSGSSDPAGNLPASPSSTAVKEEPCDVDKVLIKWETSQQEADHGDTQENKSPAGNHVQEPRDVRNIRTKAHAPPDGCPFAQRQHLRMKKKKSVPMAELSEEAQRLKRAAWRAASRRYYARKVARQQAGSVHAAMLSQVRDFRSSRVQRRTLMQELPDRCQVLQRDASSAYRTPTVPHRQAVPACCVGVHQGAEWPEEPLEPSGGSSGSSGGFLCS